MPLRSRIIILCAAVLTLTLGCTPSSEVTPSFYEQSPSESLTEELHQELAINVDDALEIFEASNLSLTENKSRSAAVKVVRPLENGHGSGTYLKMHGRFVVVTAAHVVGKATTMFIDGRDNERVIGSLVYIDHDNDLAVLVVPALKTRSPIQYRPKRSSANLIGAKINYTGFPGRHDLLTIRGAVASLEHGMIVVNMFGWFGSSGSGVYDSQGRLLGVVSGIDVGNYMIPLPLHSIVWVAPIWELDGDILKSRVKSAPSMAIIKSFPGARAPRRGTARD